MAADAVTADVGFRLTALGSAKFVNSKEMRKYRQINKTVLPVLDMRPSWCIRSVLTRIFVGSGGLGLALVLVALALVGTCVRHKEV